MYISYGGKSIDVAFHWKIFIGYDKNLKLVQVHLVLDSMESTSKDDSFISHFETLIDETQINNKSSKTTIEFSSSSLGSCQFSSSLTDKSPILPCSTSTIDSFSIKKSLLSNIETSGCQLTSLQLDFFSLIHNYYDIYYPNRTNTNDVGEQLRFVICLHLINHVLKTRSRILSHNSKLKENPDLDYHDQGFTRPKILIIVPFRESVRRIIDCFENLLLTIDDSEKTDQIQISHRKRFKEEYGGGEIDNQENDGKFQRTSNEYNEIFTGNIDDHFRLGIYYIFSSLEFCAGSTFRTRARPEKFILTCARPDPSKFNPSPIRPDRVQTRIRPDPTVFNPYLTRPANVEPVPVRGSGRVGLQDSILVLGQGGKRGFRDPRIPQGGKSRAR